METRVKYRDPRFISAQRFSGDDCFNSDVS
ncbi:hypothetical protein COLO4_37528 [Corchorus olitorius]|uniref:Uncharacterized protein n=1 Tax=Corchorus olitorius TaxID=93759 RepID=A0A1R3G110_9ROSI|nr:hypothetical protein COLO4_37528 [Corchorus olitorius]